MLAMLTLESLPSIRWMYKRFHTSLMPASINSYYRCLKTDTINDWSITAQLLRIALSSIPTSLANEPLFISIDDTIISKAGKHFDCVSKLFDHAMHNGTSYVNGHCFVSLMLSVPIEICRRYGSPSIRYIHVPIAYKLWAGEKTKLEIAAELTKAAMKELIGKRVFLLCDSWYPKKTFINNVLSEDGLEIICNVRSDTAIYDLPPAHNGKRGRPRKRGEKLSLDDIELSYEDGNFKMGHRQVKTNTFGERTVEAYVTVSESGAKRLFICTAKPPEIMMNCAAQEDSSLRVSDKMQRKFLPMKLYNFRWNIEISYYEQKTFWSLEKYMVRRQCSIERILNLICVAHASMRLLPYIDEHFAKYKDCSSQELRLVVSRHIYNEIFLSRLLCSAKNAINSSTFINRLCDIVHYCLRLA